MLRRQRKNLTVSGLSSSRRHSASRYVEPSPERSASRSAGRVAGRARTQTAVPAPAPASGGGEVAHSPLNTNVVAESASRLGLTVREIPATVEVIDQQTIREQGYRTVSEVAQGAVGVTSGDNPAEPSAFSMRGFTNSQINTLYNGIKIGPQNMTSRVMDTANLESVEISERTGIVDVRRRCGRRRRQLCDKAANHRTDPE